MDVASKSTCTPTLVDFPYGRFANRLYKSVDKSLHLDL
jgi:hypothetical protein